MCLFYYAASDAVVSPANEDGNALGESLEASADPHPNGNQSSQAGAEESNGFFERAKSGFGFFD